MSKFLRDLKRIAGEEGFVYEGYAGGASSGPGSGHYVFTHAASGAVVRTSSTPKNEGNTLKNARANFRRVKKLATSKAGSFRNWMLKRYKVGRNGSKVVEFSVSELTAEFNAGRPADEQIKPDHVGVMIGQDPMFERLGFQPGGSTRGSSTTTVRVMGPLYGVTKEPEAPVSMDLVCGADFQTPEKGIAVCVLEKGHSGLHWDSYRNVRWAEGSGMKVRAQVPTDPVIDPVAQEALHALPKLAEQVGEPTMTPAPAVLEPVTVGGLTLPDELADQLREALGVPNAAMAADVHDATLLALKDAQSALQMALDALNGLQVTAPTTVRTRKVGKKDASKIGPIQRNRLDLIVAAVADGRLNERFTVAEVQTLLGLREGQTVSTLARGERYKDTVRRVAHNTYELRI